jgi:hypothetical protein
MGALDDGKRDPHRIKHQALRLMSKPAGVYAAIARYSPAIAQAAMHWREEIDEGTNSLWGDLAPDQRAWWQFIAPPPPWLQKNASSDKTRLSALYKALRIGPPPGVTSNDQDLADLQAEDLLYVEKKFHEQIERAVPLLPGNLSLISELRGERWEFWKTERIQYATWFILHLAPLISGLSPAREANHSYRNTRDLREAKKRGGTGGRYARATGTEVPWAVQVQVDPDNTPDTPLIAPGPAAEVRADAAQEMDESRKRWGASGVIMCRALAQGATYPEAAAEAGISESTLRRRLETLRSGRLK